MQLRWLVLLLLSFPVIEALGIFWAASAFGAWVLVWLLAAALSGMFLIRFERTAWSARLLFSLQAGAQPLSALFASGRVLLAGGLLLFPGFISDVIALGLLLMPGTWRHAPTRRTASDDTSRAPTTLEGEYRREQDDANRLR